MPKRPFHKVFVEEVLTQNRLSGMKLSRQFETDTKLSYLLRLLELTEIPVTEVPLMIERLQYVPAHSWHMGYIIADLKRRAGQSDESKKKTEPPRATEEEVDQMIERQLKL